MNTARRSEALLEEREGASVDKKAMKEKISKRELKEFMESARRGRGEEIRAVLVGRPELALARSSFKKTALMICAESGGVDAIKELIALSDLNARDWRGNTALIISAGQGSVEITALLMEGTDASIRNEMGNSALEEALMWGGEGVVKLLLPVSDPRFKFRSGMDNELRDAEEAARRGGAPLLAELIAERKRVLQTQEELEALLPRPGKGGAPRV